MKSHNYKEVGGENIRHVAGLLQKLAVLPENESLLTGLEKLLRNSETVPTRNSIRETGIGQDRLVRLKEVLQLIPVGRSTWFAGVKSGRYPSSVRYLGPRITAWKLSEIMQLVNGGQP